MKVFVEPDDPRDRAMARVAAACRQYAPKFLRNITGSPVEFTRDFLAADLVVFHVNGRHNSFLRRARAVLARGGRYAVIQYAIRSTMAPALVDWFDLWQKATVVWSYYDIEAMAIEDGVRVLAGEHYCAPLGVDTLTFRPHDKSPDILYAAATTGSAWTAESVREVALAAKEIGQRVIHVGREMGRPWMTCISGVHDMVVAAAYRASRVVCGLRRTEGFELPAAEGLCCGTRPVLFDRAHYRKWYGDMAIYIPENDRLDVIHNMVRVLTMPIVPVRPDEIARARELFNWERVAGTFMLRALA